MIELHEQVQEDDGLPHKICFRCSAKIEELYEFIQKCINTQKSLHTKLGKKEPTTTKPKARELWEAKLNKSNISNDELCDAVIKKAMENIKDIANIPALMDDDKLPIEDNISKKNLDVPALNTSKIVFKQTIKTEEINSDSSVNEVLPVSNISKLNINKPKHVLHKKPTNAPSESSSDHEELPSRPTRKATRKVIVESDSESEKESTRITRTKQIDKQKEQTSDKNTNEESPVKNDNNQRIDQLSFDYVENEKIVEKPFNIMDHISMIKVNNVGVLFQCKLCNRNFLKKEVVEAHGCAKNGVPKVDFIQTVAKPDPPKITTVKYINTKIDGDLKKSNVSQKMPTAKTDIEIKKEPVEIKATPKPKPKIGPASRVRRSSANQIDPKVGMVVKPQESSPPPTKQTKSAPQESAPSIHIPSMPGLPSLNSRYKLVPGPNNTFSLVEDKNQEIPTLTASTANDVPPSRKRKSDSARTEMIKKKVSSGDDIIDLDDLPTSQPYPVGLFQTVPPNATAIPEASTALPSPAPFTTPAMKKQSYSIVKTSNPSKILISTKPQAEETTKKRSKKSNKQVTKEGPEQKQPFTVTHEENEQPKDQGFFTFINVDPLLQPSFVLPVDSIIQESQITTSSSAVIKKAAANDKNNPYSCNMCSKSFNREKKLLSHIQSHYNKIDDEDQARAEKTRKQSKKS